MQEKSTVQHISSWLLDTVFPRSCLSCHRLLAVRSPHRYLCAKCMEFVRYQTSFRCAFCTNTTIMGATCQKCDHNHSLDRLLVTVDYQDKITERIVKALKYRFATEVAQDIGELMATFLVPKLPFIDFNRSRTIIVPIPLHTRRLRWRGFNQAELIAREIASRLELPLEAGALKRLTHGTPQADIKNREDRIKNARGLFALSQTPSALPLQLKGESERVRGQVVLLIDDLSTTGSTLNEAAHVLKSAGAREVIGFVFARG
ncbi:MAG: phosphoribosyltransferase family protein [Patescibacteria group bacterium]